MGLFDRFRRAEEISRGYVGPAFSIQDPALAEFIGTGLYGTWNDASVLLNENIVLGVTAAWAAVGMTADTIASLPLETYRTMPDGSTMEITGGLMDDPCAPFYTAYEWKALIVTHMALHGEAFLLHMYNAAGSLVALFPIHPLLVGDVKRDDNGRKLFTAQVPGNPQAQVFTEDDMTHIMWRTTDGLRGMSPIKVERQALGIAVAGEKTAAKFYGAGFLMGGLITPDEELTERQADALMAQMKAKMAGPKNAGEWAVVNASLKLQPWTMNADDAQFLESRKYSVAECCRIWGVPKVLMGEDGASSWGTGVAEIIRGWQKFMLVGYTERIAERLSRVLPNKQYVCFEYKGLLQGDPVAETASILQQHAAGLITTDEARAALGRGPLPVSPAPAAPDVPAGQTGESSVPGSL